MVPKEINMETWVHSLGREDPLEKEMATHSSILAWRIHGQRSLAGYSSWGRRESDTTEPLRAAHRRRVTANQQFVKNGRFARRDQVKSNRPRLACTTWVSQYERILCALVYLITPI